ncbi:carbohydrate-binding protein [Paenibacillus vandeheii]
MADLTGGSSKPSTGTTYEAETNTALTSSVVESIYPGYVNFNANTDAAIQWNGIYCATTGTKNVKIRYALESGTRNLDVYVSGTKVISNASFASTGSWSTWGEKTIQVSLNEGTNTLKLVTTGTEGPNIDNINVTAS